MDWEGAAMSTVNIPSKKNSSFFCFQWDIVEAAPTEAMVRMWRCKEKYNSWLSKRVWLLTVMVHSLVVAGPQLQLTQRKTIYTLSKGWEEGRGGKKEGHWEESENERKRDRERREIKRVGGRQKQKWEREEVTFRPGLKAELTEAFISDCSCLAIGLAGVRKGWCRSGAGWTLADPAPPRCRALVL